MKAAMRGVVTGALLFSVAVPQSWAWGRAGHRLTALVAEQYLTPAARAQIVQLLHKETLADVSSWADSYRNEHSETAPWHFVDIPKAEAAFDRTRDCPVSSTDPKSPWRNCATDRILYFEGRLGDTTLSEQERAIALKFVVHLIGDVHQPMHAIGDDRGGNGIAVSFMGSSNCGGSKCNLHGVWDNEIIDNQGLSEKKYVDRLMQEIKDNHWDKMTGGDPVTWVNVSHHYAVQAYAPSGALLTHEYVAEESKIVDAELALGGLRLARALNRILAAPEADESAPGRTALPKTDPVAPK